MVTSCTFEEMTLFLQSGCKTNSLWTFLIISETHHVPPDFEIYVEWYLSVCCKVKFSVVSYSNFSRMRKGKGSDRKRPRVSFDSFGNWFVVILHLRVYI